MPVLRLLVFATQIFQRPLEFLPVFALTHLPPDKVDESNLACLGMTMQILLMKTTLYQQVAVNLPI